nr:hypothetical protein [Tanacetum cinerariifolium]
STLLVPPPETPPLSAPKPKENPEHGPHQPPIPYPSRLQKDKSQALENPNRRGDYFVYYINIVDHSSDKISIQKGKSSGSTTSHFDHSLYEYESFYFDVDLKEFEDLLYHYPSINPPHIVGRSDSHHEEFASELAHIISPSEYDRFYFDIKVVPGDLTRLLDANSSSESVNLNKIIEDNKLQLKESKHLLTIHELNMLCLLFFISASTSSEEFYENDPLLSFPFGNENKVFNPRILMVDGIDSFTRKSTHLPNGLIKECHISGRDIRTWNDTTWAFIFCSVFAPVRLILGVAYCNLAMVGTQNTSLAPVVDDHVQNWVNEQLEAKLARLKDELTAAIERALNGTGTRTIDNGRQNGEGTSRGRQPQFTRQFVKLMGENASWNSFKEAILLRFGDANDDPMAEIKNLRHVGTIEEYQNAFDKLISMIDLLEDQQISFYIAGL